MPIQNATETHLPQIGESRPPSPKQSGVRIVFYLVVVLVVGLIAWRVYQNHQKQAAATASQAAALQGRPVPVQVVSAEQKQMPIFLAALGTVTPYMSVTVKARVGGELLPVKFTEGQQVKTGETIMVIDPKPYQAALDQAKGTLAHDQALLKNAQAEYNRYKALYEAGVVSKESMEANEAQRGQYEGAIQSDQAAIETAQLQLSWCYIKAPIDGKIGLRLVDPGNIISANNTNLVIINQFKPIAVYFTLPEAQLPQVLRKLAADHRMTVEAFDRSDTQKLATGVLLTADNQIDTTTGTGKLKAVFDNKDSVLFPNQFVNIHLVLENRQNALVVPSAAIQTGLNGSLFVWSLDTDASGKQVAKMQPVKVALAEGQQTILDSGPEPGAKIVVDGADRLRPGAPVIANAARQRTNQGTGHGAGQEADQNSPFPGTNSGANPGSGSPGDRPRSPSSNQGQHP
jgi:membrane fusion protein, multidrug efflux system